MLFKEFKWEKAESRAWETEEAASQIPAGIPSLRGWTPSFSPGLNLPVEQISTFLPLEGARSLAKLPILVELGMFEEEPSPWATEY